MLGIVPGILGLGALASLVHKKPSHAKQVG
jgi:hypothetical protein